MDSIRSSLALALLVLAGAAAAPLRAQATARHPFTVDDMLAMERISDPQPSPDGKWVAFTLRTTDLAANRGRTDLWIAATDGSSTRRLTEHPDADSHPRWMPDGSAIAFLSSRGGSSQIWTIAPKGGEAKPLSSFPVDVGGFAIARDGKRFAVALEVYPDAKTLEETAARDAARAKDPVKALAYDTLLFRHWDSWEDGKRSHVFAWEPGSETPPVDVMPGMDADCPTRPFGGSEDFTWFPGGTVVCLAAKPAGRDAAWSTNVDLWMAMGDASLPMESLTKENRALDGSPVFSPDGQTLAYLAMDRPGYESDKQTIVLAKEEGAPRRLTEGWDRSAQGIEWSRDGKTIYTSATHLGNVGIFAIDVASGRVTPLATKGTNESPRVAGDRIVYLHDDLGSPAEIWSMKPDGSDAKPVTRVNADRVAGIEWGAWEQFSFPGWNGETVHGFVVKPAGHVEGRKAPVAFLIHGGPQGSFGDHFHYRWNPQAYAGAGFAAVFIDFHGSTGYGQAFTDSIRGDWGGKPYEDLMKGLDFALAKYPFLDGDRVVALGASFGGYMINWINGQTDRFKALVCHDGNLDERMAYFDTEELWFPEWDHVGTPWENPGGYAKHNPIDHVSKWKTPTLVIHGALDYRVVDTQGLSTFTALQRRGVPSRLLYFPDENHWVLKPHNSRRWHHEVLAWISRYAQ